ncbi:MAG: NADP-dependent phosphogluconate dehydrogenase, partial [Cyclobacteriaceae bacterium]|nr:NADP-dependent phosphogluconate dehydrogenase [Cyclobacteriaceae bacterium]
DYLKEKGIRFMGAGVSGGAKGARFGPSIMPGGDQESYELVRPVFEAAAARVEGEPCVDFMGKGSAGNYVKMVHNGIEYALMQLISEVYQLMNDGMQLSNMEMAETFANWNEGRLRSFLVEITAEIFTKPDEFQEGELVDYILDKAKQKGTGKWTSQNAMDLGVAVPSLDAAVSMRQLSSMKEVRIKAEALYPRTKTGMTERISLHDLENALYFGYIISYAQGMTQLAVASEEYTYGVSMERIAKIWRGGCIIRAALLEDMRAAYDRQPDLQSLLLDAAICQKLMDCVPSARRVIRYAIELEVPTLSLSACLNYFDAFRSGRLPLNLIQAQRDHFGSHTYERTDRPGIFHTEW